MARLTSRTRAKLPGTDFAGPGRSYPVENKAHARDAKARAAEFAPPAERAKIDAKANKVLHPGGSSKSSGTKGTQASPHRPRGNRQSSY